MVVLQKHIVLGIILLLTITTVLCKKGPKKVRVKGTRAPKTKKIRPPRPPKMNLRTLTGRLIQLESQVTELTNKIARVDSAQGLFADEPPCPIASAEGFNGSKQLGSCYRMEPTSQMMNWSDAQAFCGSLHPKAHLVAIDSESEQKFLKSKWYNECGVSSLARFWTDGSKRSLDDWFWVSGNTRLVDTYQNWITTTSHDDERFSCIAVYANEAYSWGDVACWAPHVVTCEIEL